MDLRNHIFPIDNQLCACRAAQSGVQNRPVLGRVDPAAREHGIATLLDVSQARQVTKCRHHLGIHPVLGVVEQQIVKLQREPLEPARIGSKQFPHGGLFDAFAMGLERQKRAVNGHA